VKEEEVNDRKEKCCYRRVGNIYALYKPSGTAGLCVAVALKIRNPFSRWLAFAKDLSPKEVFE